MSVGAAVSGAMQAAISAAIQLAVNYALSALKGGNQAAQQKANKPDTGFELVVEGQAIKLPFIYGRQLVAGARVYHNTNSDFYLGTSTADKILQEGPDGKASGVFKVKEVVYNNGFQDRKVVQKTYNEAPDGLLNKTITAGKKNQFLYFQQALCIGPINRVVDVIIDDSFYLNDPKVNTYKGSKFDGNNRIRGAFRIDAHYGNGPDYDGIMGTNFNERFYARFTDIAYLSAVVRLNEKEPQWYDVPKLQALIEGRKVRTSSNGVLNSTRIYTNNNAWCLLDYLLDPDGANIPVEDIDLSSFEAAAAICARVVKEDVPVGGKIFKPTDEELVVSTRDITLYECNILLDTDRPVRDNIQAILATMGDARLVWSQGKYRLSLQYPESNETVSTVATLTDNDLVLDQDIEIRWPSAADRFNSCTVKYKNESENFKEDTVSWPPKVTATYLVGVGGIRYGIPEAGGGNTGAGKLLNSYGIWVDTEPTADFEFVVIIRKAFAGACKLQFCTDASESSTRYFKIFDYDTGVQLYNFTTEKTEQANGHDVVLGDLTQTEDKAYLFKMRAVDNKGKNNFAARLSQGSFTLWTTRDLAYSSVRLVEMTDTLYQQFLQEDNGVDLPTEVEMEGTSDYYHALAKAEEIVRTSRNSVTYKFRYFVTDKYLEPGDFIKLYSAEAKIGTQSSPVILRVQSSRLVEDSSCEVEAVSFDYRNLAWNVDDDYYPNDYLFVDTNVPTPESFYFVANRNSVNNSPGTLYWNQPSDIDIDTYIIYAAYENASVDSLGQPEFLEIGRARTTYFHLPETTASSAIYGLKVLTRTGILSKMITTSDDFAEILKGNIVVTENLNPTITNGTIACDNFLVSVNGRPFSNITGKTHVCIEYPTYGYYSLDTGFNISSSKYDAIDGDIIFTATAANTLTLARSTLYPPDLLDLSAGNVYFEGVDVNIEWTDNMLNNSIEDIPYAYSVKLYDINDVLKKAFVLPIVKQTNAATNSEYQQTYLSIPYTLNQEIFNTPQRSFKIKVYAVNSLGYLSSTSRDATVENSIGTITELIKSEGYGYVKLTANSPTWSGFYRYVFKQYNSASATVPVNEYISDSKTILINAEMAVDFWYTCCLEDEFGRGVETVKLKATASRVKAAVSLFLEAQDLVFEYTKKNILNTNDGRPGSTTITVTGYNLPETPYYSFFLNDNAVASQDGTSNTFLYNAKPDYLDMPEKVTVRVRDSYASTDTLAEDYILFTGWKEGSSGLLPRLSNPIQIITADSGGNISLVNTGTKVYVYDGADTYDYSIAGTNQALVNGSFRIVSREIISGTGTLGLYKTSATDYIEYDNLISLGTDQIVIRYTVAAKNYSGAIKELSVDQTISKVTGGVSPTIVDLKSESDVTAAEDDGTGYSLPPDNELSLYFEGDKLVNGDNVPTGSIVFSGGGTSNGLTANINASTGIISFSGNSWTADTANFLFSATYEGTTYSAGYSYAKSRKGTDAVLMDIVRDNDIVLASSTGLVTTLPQANQINIWKKGQIKTTNVTYKILGTNGYITASAGTPAELIRSGLKITLYSNGSFTIIQDSSWSTDRESFTLAAVFDGTTYESNYVILKSKQGTPGLDSIYVDLDSESDITAASQKGLGYTLPPQNKLTLYKGGSVVLSGVTYSGTSTQGGLTATIDPSTGIITFSGIAWITDTASFTFTATYNGNQYSAIYTYAKSKKGDDAILIDLLSENQPVYADENGVVTTLPSGNAIKLIKGGVQLTTGVTYSGTATKNGLTLTVNNDGTFALSQVNWSTNQESFLLKATYETIEYATIYTITKQVKGDKGDNLVVYSIKLSSDVIVKEAKDAVTTGNYTTLQVWGEKTEGADTLQYGYVTITKNGDAQESATVINVNTTKYSLVTASNSQITGYTVRLYDTATKTTLLDTQSISVLYGGTDGIVAILTNESVSLPSDVNDVVTSYTGASTTMKVYKGGIDVSNEWTYSAVLNGLTCNEVSTSPTQTVATLTNPAGFIDITASKTGYSSITKRFNVMKSRRGATGTGGITAYLTNPSHNLYAASNGAITQAEYDASITEIKVLEAGVDVSNSWSYSATVSNSAVFAVSITGNTLKVTSLSADSAYADITLTRAGYSTLSLRYTAIRVKAAVNGVSPVIVTLTATQQAIVYDSNGLTPSPSSITLVANAKNVGATTYYYKFTIDSVALGVTKSSTTGINVQSDAYTAPSSFFSSPKEARVSVYSDSGLTNLVSYDTFSLVGNRGGVDGASAKSVKLQNNIGSIAYNENGLSPSYSSLLFTTLAQNLKYTGYYRFLVNGSEVQGYSTTSTYTVSIPSSFANMPITLTVEMKDVPSGSTPAQVSLAASDSFPIGATKNSVNGQTTYLHIKYSDDGTTFTANNGETVGAWIGTYTDFSATDSLTFSAYTWNKIQGATGTPGINTATIYLYYRGTSAPSAVNLNATYTFSNKSVTWAAGTLTSAWQTAIPSGTDDLYVTIATAVSDSSTDTILTSEWSTPQILAKKGSTGTPGTSSFVATIYKQAADAGGTPYGGSYNFSNNTLTVPTNIAGWSATQPSSSTTPTWISKYTFYTTDPTATVSGVAWSTPVVFAQNGTNGTKGDPGTPGASAISHTMILSHRTVRKNEDGTFTPPLFTAYGLSQEGSNRPVNIQYNFTVTKNGSINSYYYVEYSINHIIDPDTTSLKIKMYLTSGNLDTVAEEYITIVSSGKSARIAYIVTASSTPPTLPYYEVSGDALPPNPGSYVSGWSKTAYSSIGTNNYMHQVDGLYDSLLNKTVWGLPYPGYFKVGQLSSIVSSTGTLTVNTAGYIASENVQYNSGVGFFLGYNAGYKFFVGNSAGNKLLWDGSNLEIVGSLKAGSTIDGVATSIIASAISSDPVLGFNALFADWVGELPTNWSSVFNTSHGSISKETNLKLSQKNSIKFVINNPIENYYYIVNRITVPAKPIGSFVEGSVSVNIQGMYTSGSTGIKVRLWYDNNAAFLDTNVPANTTTQYTWQTLNFVAKVPVNKQITRVEVYIMPSHYENWQGTTSKFSGTIYFDNLNFSIVSDSTSSTKLSKTTNDILNARISLAVDGAVSVGSLTWDGAGNRINGLGVAITPYGILAHNNLRETFRVSASTGAAKFGGNVEVGSYPAISGSSMTGSGAALNYDGTFALGNSSTNISFNGNQLTLNGNVVSTGNVQSNAISKVYTAYGNALTITSTSVIPTTLVQLTGVVVPSNATSVLITFCATYYNNTSANSTVDFVLQRDNTSIPLAAGFGNHLTMNITAKGNSTVSISRTFIDNTVQAGTYSYQLKPLYPNMVWTVNSNSNLILNDMVLHATVFAR